MLSLRRIEAYRLADFQQVGPQIGIVFVIASEIPSAPSNQIGAGLWCVRKSITVDGQQLGMHESVEQYLELLRPHGERPCKLLGRHRTILKRCEDVELHASQQRHRRIDRKHVTEDRARLGLAHGRILAGCNTSGLLGAIVIAFAGSLSSPRADPVDVSSLPNKQKRPLAIT
jgi:hypothetical protein